MGKRFKRERKRARQTKKRRGLTTESISEIEEQIESKKSQIEEIKSEASDHEADKNKLKKKLFSHNKEVNDFRKEINSIEAKIMDKKLERHAILKNSKLDLIDLPMIFGSMDDINEEDLASQAPQHSENTPESSKAPIVTLTKQNKLLENEKETLASYQQRLNTVNQNLEAEKRDLLSLLDKKTKENDRLFGNSNQKIYDLESKIEEYSAENRKNKNLMDALQNANHSMETQIDELTKKLQELYLF